MLLRAEDVVGQGEELLGFDHEARLLQGFPFSTRKIALSHLKMASRELPLSCDVLESMATNDSRIATWGETMTHRHRESPSEYRQPSGLVCRAQ